MAWRMVPPVLSPVDPLAVPAAMIAGRRVQSAPDRLRALLGERYAADRVELTASGTQALQLAITIALQRSGHRATVALPGFGCYDLATAAVGAGVQVRLYDIDPSTLSPDLESLEQALDGPCGAAVVAPLYGVPVDWERIGVLARRFEVAIIEDAAQGHGARWRGRPLGSLGEISILSFGRGKGWTGGHGGALLLRESFGGSEIPETASYHHRTTGPLSVAAQWLFTRPSLYRVPASVPALALGETRYREPQTPTVMDPATAYLILSNEAASNGEVAARRRAANDYDRLCAGTPLHAVPVPDGGLRGALRYPVLVSVARSLPSEIRALGAWPAYPRALAELPALGPFLQASPAPAPGAQRLASELLTLPTHSKVRSRQRARLVQQLANATVR